MARTRLDLEPQLLVATAAPLPTCMPSARELPCDLDDADDDIIAEPPVKRQKRKGKSDGCAEPATSPKESASASAKREAKKAQISAARAAKAKAKAGKKLCGCCRKSIALELFAWDSAKCMQCKKSLDMIYYVCKKQDQLDWLKEQKAPRRFHEFVALKGHGFSARQGGWESTVGPCMPSVGGCGVMGWGARG